ncbi:MAG TPA: cytochrome C oxidase subunit I [Hanamia sp.]|nr:cytochrome C oxidase subunit I [Hanamia sp.]
MISGLGNSQSSTTTYKVVMPFYVYASLSFLAATILLFFSSSAFVQHYFHPKTLAITHSMALGWGTMIILGASHQLVPVLIERKLYSTSLALTSFALAAIGIPLLVYGFYNFDFGSLTQIGALLVIGAISVYLVNLLISMSKSQKENVHATFVFTATLWLLLTAVLGYLLIINFTHTIFSQDSLEYLPLHAHLGIIGWFLLLVTGIGSRLIPMFLISKYDNPKMLWWVYGLINTGLVLFVILFLFFPQKSLFLLPVILVIAGIVIFARFCYKAYRQRLRKKVDEQVKTSLLSVMLMLLPFIFLIPVIIMLLFSVENTKLVLAYGFCIFFGWITAIILGMTFKTLPFIQWNKTYHHKARSAKTPSPADLFNHSIFNYMVIVYLTGFVLFVTGILSANGIILKLASFILLLAAVLYNGNVFKILMHKAK